MSPQNRSKLRFWLVFYLVLVVYLLTRAPGFTWSHRGADGGDFIAAAANLGVPHPAGYPSYTLLIRLFMLLPVKEPAAAGSLLSALMGAVAAAVSGEIILLLLEPLARGWQQRRMAVWASVSGACTFAFMPLVWGQALITEVYSFHLALVSTAFWLLLRWRQTGRGLPWIGLVMGLGMTNHLTTAFLAPAALAIVVAGRRHLKPRIQRGIGRHRGLLQILAASGAFFVGLAPYTYIPWAARRMPPVNWENAQTWENFQKLIMASRYSHNLFDAPLEEVLNRISGWFGSLPPVALVPVLLLLGTGLLWLLLRDPAAGAMTGIYALLSASYAAGYGTTDYWVNLLPAILMLSIWLAAGIYLLLRWTTRHQWRGSAVLRPAAILLSLLIPSVLLLSSWHEMDIHDDRVATDWVARALDVAEEDALVFTRSDQFTFGMWYACYALDERPDIVPILPTFLRRIWYRKTLAANHDGLDLRPDGLGAEALQTMIRRHLDDRPIYLTWEDETTSENYGLVKEWPLWRVTTKTASE